MVARLDTGLRSCRGRFSCRGAEAATAKPAADLLQQRVFFNNVPVIVAS
jgi:hypothetical protein